MSESGDGWDCTLCGTLAGLSRLDGASYVVPHRRPGGGSEWCPAGNLDDKLVPGHDGANALLAAHRLARQTGDGSGRGAWWRLGDADGDAMVLPSAVGDLHAGRMDWGDTREVTLPGGMRALAPGLLLAGEGEA